MQNVCYTNQEQGVYADLIKLFATIMQLNDLVHVIHTKPALLYRACVSLFSPDHMFDLQCIARQHKNRRTR